MGRTATHSRRLPSDGKKRANDKRQQSTAKNQHSSIRGPALVVRRAPGCFLYVVWADIRCGFRQPERGMELWYNGWSVGLRLRPQPFGLLQPEIVGHCDQQKTYLLEVWGDWSPLLLLIRKEGFWTSGCRRPKSPSRRYYYFHGACYGGVSCPVNQAEKLLALAQKSKDLKWLLNFKMVNGKDVENPWKVKRILTVVKSGSGARQIWEANAAISYCPLWHILMMWMLKDFSNIVLGGSRYLFTLPV